MNSPVQINYGGKPFGFDTTCDDPRLPREAFRETFAPDDVECWLCMCEISHNTACMTDGEHSVCSDCVR